MTEDVENLVLEHLRAIRSEIGNVKDEMRTMKAELASIRQQVGAVTILVQQSVEDIATVRVRLDRIERRLDLADAPK